MVDHVDAQRIVIRVNDDEAVAGEVGVDIYNLTKYTRSNQNTNINQRTIVGAGGWCGGCGRRISRWCFYRLRWISPWSEYVDRLWWHGYNFEDSILILSEQVVSEDRYTSIHIEELSVMARQTKLGDESITRDIF